jgi:DNA (cytosine-5)-methyltransferase 1
LEESINVDITETTHISLCSGYGGIDLGLRRVLSNVRTIAYVEIEAWACANLVEKMESKQLDAAPIWTNLKTFDAKPFRGNVGILSGGFPCQPFSHAGQRKGTEDPRHLFPDIERIIVECQPSIVFLENVEGIISAKYQGEPDTSVLKYVLERLEKMDYTATAGVFSAIECGAPHQRKRVFICGVSNARRNDETTRRQREALQEGSNEWDVKGGSGCDAGSGLLRATGCSSRGEVADTDSLGHGGRSSEGCPDGERVVLQGEQGRSSLGSETQGCSELGDTDSKHRWREQGQGQSEGKTFGECTENDGRELGNTNCKGLQGHGEEPRGLDSIPSQEAIGLRCSKFPSRPNEEQQPWEYPRTIGDEEIISAMGGSTHGSTNGNMVHTCRVDALRLLGNGVVPVVASKAFVTLMARLNKGETPME